MNKRGRPPYPDILTPREWEVLALVRQGLSNEEIANRLGISVNGVKYHVSEILSKLGLENRSDAARWRPEEARPWWLAAGAPALFWRKLSFGWLSPALAGGLAVAVAAGVGLLVWALVATRGDGELSSAASIPIALPAGDRLAYVAGPPGTPEASAAPRGGDLWIVEAGQPPRQLTKDGDARSPLWSPDGRYLLFFRGVDLWLMDVDGDLERIDEGVVSARWSPGSDRIAYWPETPVEGPNGEVSVSTGGGVWLYDLERGEKERLLPADFRVVDLAWAPDGHQLALARYVDPVFDRSEEPVRVQFSPDSTLWLLTFEDDGVVDLRRVFSRDELAEVLFGDSGPMGPTGVSGLTWSPDGEWIGFHVTSLSASLAADGLPFVTVRRDGTGLAHHGIMLKSPTLYDWAPEGHTLTITLGGGRDLSYGKTIGIVEAGVEGARLVGEEPARYQGRPLAAGEPTPVSARSDAHPAWSPDGTRLAFQASEAGFINLNAGKVEGPKEGIWVVNADGTEPRQLTSDPDYLDFYPRWSADGELILFIRTTADRAELWVMRSDGSEAKRLVTNLLRIGSYYGLFSWEQYVAWHQAQ